MKIVGPGRLTDPGTWVPRRPRRRGHARAIGPFEAAEYPRTAERQSAPLRATPVVSRFEARGIARVAARARAVLARSGGRSRRRPRHPVGERVQGRAGRPARQRGRAQAGRAVALAVGGHAPCVGVRVRAPVEHAIDDRPAARGGHGGRLRVRAKASRGCTGARARARPKRCRPVGSAQRRRVEPSSARTRPAGSCATRPSARAACRRRRRRRRRARRRRRRSEPP